VPHHITSCPSHYTPGKRDFCGSNGATTRIRRIYRNHGGLAYFTKIKWSFLQQLLTHWGRRIFQKPCSANLNPKRGLIRSYDLNFWQNHERQLWKSLGARLVHPQRNIHKQTDKQERVKTSTREEGAEVAVGGEGWINKRRGK